MLVSTDAHLVLGIIVALLFESSDVILSPSTAHFFSFDCISFIIVSITRSWTVVTKKIGDFLDTEEMSYQYKRAKFFIRKYSASDYGTCTRNS